MINFFIKTYGCQANVADSQALSNYLMQLGAKQVSNEKDADLIFINTCAIRERAEEKFFSYLGSFVKFKNLKPYLKIGVIGCVASYRKKEIFSRFGLVDFVFGVKEDSSLLKNYIIDLVLKLNVEKKIYYKISDEFFEQNEDLILSKQNFSNLYMGGFKNSNNELKKSFINIMTGCNNYCSYCIVPFTRGREKSYPANEILKRVEQDVASGAKEIMLLGQNVNSYKDPQSGKGFAKLLNDVAKIDGDFWVRFVSSHPKDMTKDVLHVMADNKDKLCGFVHYPIQSGSNKILRVMNRIYTVEQYLEQIGWIKDILSEATISTDVIVGFPGETEQDYLQTCKVLKEVKFYNVFSFIYSPRKYTRAALLKDDCPKKVKLKRLEALQEMQRQISKDLNFLNVGKTLKCLVEKRLANDKLLARTQGNIRVLFEGGDDIIGTFVYLKIKNVGVANMLGSLI
ncbi:tRNA (N6-isopentenyl adenosine(37)-C2)-methylthiotransferase MiaB [Candidatus Babeliales bacterium]|nr:tRNA (N6-isopentenyl adenosine(37)-C2)-methylthiotransferase MiaB [Candidatus Babeliales bacterium]